MENIAALEVIGANLLDMASRMPGAQSDKELLIQLSKTADIANANKPANARLKAFDKFLDKFKEMKATAEQMGGQAQQRRPITFKDGRKGFAVFKDGKWVPEAQ